MRLIVVLITFGIFNHSFCYDNEKLEQEYRDRIHEELVEIEDDGYDIIEGLSEIDMLEVYFKLDNLPEDFIEKFIIGFGSGTLAMSGAGEVMRRIYNTKDGRSAFALFWLNREISNLKMKLAGTRIGTSTHSNLQKRLKSAEKSKKVVIDNWSNAAVIISKPEKKLSAKKRVLKHFGSDRNIVIYSSLLVGGALLSIVFDDEDNDYPYDREGAIEGQRMLDELLEEDDEGMIPVKRFK